MDQVGDDLHREDRAWADALARGERDALVRYEHELVPVIATQLAGRGFTPDEVDELQQTLRERLFVHDGDTPPAIATYAGRGPLRAWVLIIAIREAIKQRQRAAKEPAVDDDALIALAERASAAEPPGGADKARYLPAFRAAFATALAELAPRDRTLLRLSAIDGLSIDQIGALNGVHRATAARWIERARDAVARGVRRDLMRQLDTDRWETDELLAWVYSRVDLSLGGLSPGHQDR
jgi:RNA polymerase sigma-70 factor (ECF subfamily)